jgi:hypothetical protein
MGRSKLKKTVLWQGPSELHFLCRVLNIGRSTDELKIIVTEPDSPTGAMYTEGKGRFTGTELVRLQAEVSYHSDGTLLQKLPSYSRRTSTEYRNPLGVGARRLPLRQIRQWEPFARYTVIRPAGAHEHANGHRQRIQVLLELDVLVGRQQRVERSRRLAKQRTVAQTGPTHLRNGVGVVARQQVREGTGQRFIEQESHERSAGPWPRRARRQLVRE